uniref:Uncharacterized protein AlNc14C2G233 n=1 Tax=Albugo laibachii Nc14 TaxID=890382 RepID=F0VZ92_9STRA|nr:conserved hypothetical protein [Albugo laibachii Nc14]|eukprot:CCA14122.1 conserved hypothetical protein [Albugo laibachii Nc14]
MQFTPQQLIGAARYQPCTRIGNWNEELMLEEALRKANKQSQSGSALSAFRQKQQVLDREARRSFDVDGYIRYNQVVSIRHIESEGALACNIFEESPSFGSNEFLVTILQTLAIPVRAVFRIISPTEYVTKRDSVILENAASKALRYGDEFYLGCSEALLEDEQSAFLRPLLFLKSGLKTERSMSPVTYNQRIWTSQNADSSALWHCEPADLAGAPKMLAKGLDIRTGDCITIRHKMTGGALHAQSSAKVPTDFGVEIEVCALNAKRAGKHHLLAGEELGTHAPDIEGRAQLAVNRWIFALDDCEHEQRPIEYFVATPDSVVLLLRGCVSQSVFAFRSFIVQCIRLDTRQEDLINRGHFCSLVQKLRLPLRAEHIDLWLDSIVSRSSERIPMDKLLASLRLPRHPGRSARFAVLFNQLVDAAGGTLTPRWLSDHKDQRLQCNEMSPTDAMQGYLDLWGVSPSKAISEQQFIQVMEDITTAIKNEQELESFLQSSWRQVDS